MLSHSPATTDGGWGLAEMVCTPVLLNPNILMVLHYAPLRQGPVNMGLVE